MKLVRILVFLLLLWAVIGIGYLLWHFEIARWIFLCIWAIELIRIFTIKYFRWRRDQIDFTKKRGKERIEQLNKIIDRLNGYK